MTKLAVTEVEEKPTKPTTTSPNVTPTPTPTTPPLMSKPTTSSSSRPQYQQQRYRNLRQATEAPPYKRSSAAVIVYTTRPASSSSGSSSGSRDDRDPLLLLGKLRGGQEAGRWCMPLGKAWDKNQRSFVEAAERELFEETVGLISAQQYPLLRTSSGGDDSLVSPLHSLYVWPHAHDSQLAYVQHYTFFCPVPYRPAADFVAELRRVESDGGSESWALLEMCDYAWVPLSELRRAVHAVFVGKSAEVATFTLLEESGEGGGGVQTGQLRRLAATVLWQAGRDGTLNHMLVGGWVQPSSLPPSASLPLHDPQDGILSHAASASAAAAGLRSA